MHESAGGQPLGLPSTKITIALKLWDLASHDIAAARSGRWSR